MTVLVGIPLGVDVIVGTAVFEGVGDAVFVGVAVFVGIDVGVHRGGIGCEETCAGRKQW